MANILNEYDQDCWMPGLVKSIEYDDFNRCDVFTIIYYNGEEGQNTNEQLIKINKSQYDMFVEFFMSKLSKAEPAKTKKKGLQKQSMSNFVCRFQIASRL